MLSLRLLVRHFLSGIAIAIEHIFPMIYRTGTPHEMDAVNKKGTCLWVGHLKPVQDISSIHVSLAFQSTRILSGCVTLARY